MKNITKVRFDEYKFSSEQLSFMYFSNIYRSLISKTGEMNWHEGIEIQFCVDGEGKSLIDGKEFDFKKDDVLIVNSYLVHYTYTNSSLIYDALIINAAFCKLVGIEYNKLYFNPVIKDSRIVEILHKFKALENDGLCSVKRCSLILEMMVLLIENHAMSEADASKIKNQNCAKDVLKYIHKNYNNKFTLEDISKETFHSVTLICKNFKSLTGKTIIEYTNHFRCVNARNMIEQGSSVTEAASACGFENLSFFSKTFKKYIGKSPNEFKQN